MPVAALITVEGVLVSDTPTPINSAAVSPSVARLWAALSSNYACWLLSRHSNEDLERWANRERLRGALYVDRPVELVGEPLHVLTRDAVRWLRARGSEVQLFVTADPQSAMVGWRCGVPSAFFAHPTYMRPEFRPDASIEITPWATIVEEIEDTATQRANDERVKQRDDLSGRWER